MRIIIRDLPPNQHYYLQLRAVSASNEFSEWSRKFTLNTQTDFTPPKTPTSVTWVVSGTSFVGTWAAVTESTDNTPALDLDHYEVQVGNGAIVKTYKTQSLRFDFPFEVNRSTFGSASATVTFQVRAVDAVGNASPYSTVISATNPPPGPVTDLQGYSGYDQIALSWVAPTDDDLAGYNLYMSDDPSFVPGPTTLMATVNGTALTYPTTLYGTDYYFKVAAVDVFGSESTYVQVGPLHAKSSFSVDADPPDVPTGLAAVLSVSSSGSTQAAVSWTAVPNPESDMATYRVRYKPHTETDWSYVTVDSSVLSTTIDRLRPYVSYDFGVGASDFAANFSGWSATVTASAATNSAPVAVTGVTAAAGSTLIGVTWSQSAEPDVAYGAGMYEASIATNTSFTTGVKAATTGALVYIFNDLVPGTVYYARVRAIDSSGLAGAWSTVTSGVTVGTLDGSVIAANTIIGDSILSNSMSADRIKANSTFTNNLIVKSVFTLGDATTAGTFQSYDYVSGTAGFKISSSGLEINQGSIRTPALAVQMGNNMLPAQYADFEAVPAFYTSSTLNLGVGQTATADLTQHKYNIQSLKVVSTAAGFVMLGTAGTYNIPIDSSQSYIGSVWVFQSSGSSKTMTLRITWSNAANSDVTAAVPNATWTRISGVFAAPSGVTGAVLGVGSPSAMTAYYDGAQVEPQFTSATTPSPWNPPGVTSIDGGTIRTGEIRSANNVTVNSVTQPMWSINVNGAAQLGSALVRGQLIVGQSSGGTDLDAGASVIKSGNYILGSKGWTIRSDGYAEFRNIAANSIKITSFDTPTQSTLGAKLYDYMEDLSLWTIRSGLVTGQVSVPGALTSNAYLELTGQSSISRDATGFVKGIAVEAEALYRITARIRQVSGDVNTADINGVNIGVLGYDKDGNLCGWDGTAAISKQYFCAASNEQLAIYDGSSGDAGGWISYTGYIKGRSNTLADGTEHPDQYDPGYINEGVRYIVPYVEANIANLTGVVQLDMFSVETFEAGAQTRVATSDAGTGMKAVTIESLEGDTFDHAIRFYSGEDGESMPGIIAQYVDEEESNSTSMIISPPLTNVGEGYYAQDNITLNSMNANMIYNSTFSDGTVGTTISRNGGGSVLSIVDDETIGRVDNFFLQITRGTGSTTSFGSRMSINPDDYSDTLYGVTDLSASAYVNPQFASQTFTLQINTYTSDDTGVETVATTNTSSTFTPTLGEWTRLSFSANYLSGIDPTTSRVAIDVICTGPIVTGNYFYTDDIQLEVGAVVSPYRDAHGSKAYFDTDMTYLNNALIISNKDENSPLPAKDSSTASNQQFYTYRTDVASNPSLFLQAESSVTAVVNFDYVDGAGASRSFTELAVFDPIVGRSGGALRIYSLQDETYPGKIALINTTAAKILETVDKNGIDDNLATTKDLQANGYLSVIGDPPWLAINTDNGFTWGTGWSATSSGYTAAYYVNYATVNLRGLIINTGSSGKTAGSTLFTLPTELRPQAPVFFSTSTWSTSANQFSIQLTITTAGACKINSTQANALQYISFDSISYSLSADLPYTKPVVTADTTAPGAPSSFSIKAKNSGKSTGAYTLKWNTPSSSDLKVTKIIYRTDRYPKVTIAGSGTKTLSTDGKVISIGSSPSQTKTYVHAGLPVNKTIYYRIVTMDKAGNHSSYVQGSRYLLGSPVTITANSSHSYRDGYGGMWRNDGDQVYQGDWTQNDNHRGLWFYGTKISDTLGKGGVSRTPTKVTIQMHRLNSSHGWNKGIPIILKAHNYSTKPGGAPTMSSNSQGIVTLSRDETARPTVSSQWYSALASGSQKGFGIAATDDDHYAILTGRGSSASSGQLTIYHNG